MDILTFGLRLVSTLIAMAIAVFLIGFAVFADSVERRPGDVGNGTDGIVALTGGKARIAAAVKLLADGKAKRLLITGVNRSTTKEDLRELVNGDEALFECCVDLDRRALNTRGNAVETKRWARSMGFKSLIVVTSSYHMPRTLVELQRVMPREQFIPYAVVARDFPIDRWWGNPKTLKVLFREYVKYLPTAARYGATRWARRRQAQTN